MHERIPPHTAKGKELSKNADNFEKLKDELKNLENDKRQAVDQNSIFNSETCENTGNSNKKPGKKRGRKIGWRKNKDTQRDTFLHTDNVIIFGRPNRKEDLSPLERLFVAEYCKDLNATRAYSRAKPTHNLSPGSLRQTACELKNRPAVLFAINQRISLKTEWVDDAKRRVIEVLLSCLSAEQLDFMDVKEDEDGDFELVLKDLRRVSKLKRLAISEITTKKSKIPSQNGVITHNTTKLKPIAKESILKLLVDVLGMKKDFDPEEKDRNAMENASKSLDRRIAGIFVGLKKRRSIEKMAQVNKKLD